MRENKKLLPGLLLFSLSREAFILDVQLKMEVGMSDST